MIYREIGKTGIRASVLSLGTWSAGGDAVWGSADDDISVRALEEGLDPGINLIDTAPAYGFGRSERIVGRVLRGRKRQDVIVATKCGLVFDEEGSLLAHRDGRTVNRNLSKKAVMKGAEESLRNLGTDYIDIYITHWQSVPPFYTPISETMEALLRLKEEGKIRAIGVSNVTTEQVSGYLACGEIALVQQRYSMLDRAAEDTLLRQCREKGLTFQAYSPLEHGLLTGKTARDFVPREGDVRSKKKVVPARKHGKGHLDARTLGAAVRKVRLQPFKSRHRVDGGPVRKNERPGRRQKT